jgi:hypothetical protein
VNGDPQLYRVVLTLCARCLAGDGGQCHTPGCALWMNQAPESPLMVEEMTIQHTPPRRPVY